MLFSFVICCLYLLPLLLCLRSGDFSAVSALMSGAGEAVSFCISVAGGICLWSAVMELWEECGAAGKLSAFLMPFLRRLFPIGTKSSDFSAAIAENVSANILGLGNAATPAGIRAAQNLAGLGDAAADELCMLVVLNTASVQLIPTTTAAIRAAAGAAAPFDILPAVWISSAASLIAGLTAARLFRKLWR